MTAGGNVKIQRPMPSLPRAAPAPPGKSVFGLTQRWFPPCAPALCCPDLLQGVVPNARLWYTLPGGDAIRHAGSHGGAGKNRMPAVRQARRLSAPFWAQGFRCGYQKNSQARD